MRYVNSSESSFSTEMNNVLLTSIAAFNHNTLLQTSSFKINQFNEFDIYLLRFLPSSYHKITVFTSLSMKPTSLFHLIHDGRCNTKQTRNICSAK